MEQILKSISSFLWGAPVLILLAAVGLLFGCKTKFFQFRKFGYILKNTAGEMFKKGGGAKGKEGTLTPLQAVSSALAARRNGEHRRRGHRHGGGRPRRRVLDVGRRPAGNADEMR